MHDTYTYVSVGCLLYLSCLASCSSSCSFRSRSTQHTHKRPHLYPLSCFLVGCEDNPITCYGSKLVRTGAEATMSKMALHVQRGRGRDSA